MRSNQLSYLGKWKIVFRFAVANVGRTIELCNSPTHFLWHNSSADHQRIAAQTFQTRTARHRDHFAHAADHLFIMTKSDLKQNKGSFDKTLRPRAAAFEYFYVQNELTQNIRNNNT